MGLGASSLQTNQKTDIAGSGGVTGAKSGVSKDGADVVLGNDEGDFTAPGKLLSNREIDLNTFRIRFLNNNQTRIIIQSNPNIYGLGFQDDVNGTVYITQQAGGLAFTNTTGTARFLWSPNFGSFSIGDINGALGLSTTTLFAGFVGDATRSVGFSVQHFVGLNAVFTGFLAHNLSGGANAQTRITAMNNQARAVFIGVGGSGAALNPNTAYVESSSANLFITAGGVGSFIVFGTQTSGSGGERMRLTATGQLAVGVAAPNASAKMQIDSTSQGFLPPRMTQAQRLAIAAPAVGLMVYQTDGVEGLYINKSTGWLFIA